MSLFKRIAWLVGLGFAIQLAVVTVSNFQQSKVYLEGQMQVTATDMATVLAITISKNNSVSDSAALETLFNAVFDSGYYTKIALYDNNDNLIHAKQRDLVVREVPDWFISLVPLNSASGYARVLDGWIPTGVLQLTVHPGFTYISLYKNLRQDFMWVVFFSVLVLALLWKVLHELLIPLTRVKAQADAIHNNKFVQQAPLPKTVELRSVVVAMNRLVSKVQKVFEDQEKTLSKYNQLLYVDQQTGLANRKSLFTEINSVLSEDSPFHGWIALISIVELEKLRSEKGYELADSIVMLLANLVDTTSERDVTTVARLSKHEFVIYTSTDIKSVEELIARIFDEFQDKLPVILADPYVYLVSGVTSIAAGQQLSDVMSSLDLAVIQAKAKGRYAHTLPPLDNFRLPKGKLEWRAWIDKSLADNRFYLVSQPVFDREGGLIHREVFVRVKDEDNNIIPAGVFMPVATELAMDVDIERRIFTLIEKIPTETVDESPLALNLTAAFFTRWDEHEEILKLLESLLLQPGSLSLEVSHAVAMNNVDACVHVSELMRKKHQYFGIDNLDLKCSFTQLHTINPDYIKASSRTLFDLSTSNLAAHQALQTLISTLEVKLIAVGIDDVKVHDYLLTTDVYGLQGNLLARALEI